jgi:2-C-methyl-D-erythritol 2,4-cyclodiphosphate synthase
MSIRVGIGYDSHRLGPGRPLVLGGVTVPFELGLEGHSDGDAIAHALTDALLGAAAMGDIGKLYPDTDLRFKGANSIELLREVVGLMQEQGFTPLQADITVIAERPKLGPHFPAMAATLGSALGLPASAIGLKAKTNEGMGFIGRGEGMAVMAVATIGSA